jgi:hypothetical protein
MTDPNTPESGDDRAQSSARPGEPESVDQLTPESGEQASESAADPDVAESTFDQPPAEPVPAEEPVLADEPASAESAVAASTAPPARPWTATTRAPGESSPAEAPPREQPQASPPLPETAAAAEPARPSPLPPLSPPSSAPATGASATAGALHDDSALRAAEAARSGAPGGPSSAPPAYGASAANGPAAETGDLDDTRITAPGGARSTSSWTPPPAPASPAEYPAPTVATPTPYAPPTTAVPAAAPQTSSTPLSTLGTSPAERLGFTEGIGGDDSFTPEEVAQRRAFRDEMSFRQKQEFSGINFAAGFFGWLAAVGLAGLLYAILGGIAVASGMNHSRIATSTSANVKALISVFDGSAVQITALVVFLFVLLLSYFVGGFVAARMARFSGLKQGLAVWLWGLVVSLVSAVVLVVVASQSNLVSDIESLGGSMSLSSLTTVEAFIAEGLIVVLSIGGALLGGAAGMRFHKRVDRFGLEEV